MEPYAAFKLYQKVCKKHHPASAALFREWSWKWAGAKNFANALAEFAKEVKK